MNYENEEPQVTKHRTFNLKRPERFSHYGSTSDRGSQAYSQLKRQERKYESLNSARGGDQEEEMVEVLPEESLSPLDWPELRSIARVRQHQGRLKLIIDSPCAEAVLGSFTNNVLCPQLYEVEIELLDENLVRFCSEPLLHVSQVHAALPRSSSYISHK